ncbi:MAG: 4-hydroxy-tetrahydrodipicolinate synthase [Solirubrobacteraceae bacterium]|nr:4-hydroxy-tetrahydrodipicolinate synthase [Solirubrobacteraceae bacterium]
MASLGRIITAIVTPFDARYHVDEDAFVGLMHHLADNGSDGFVVAGTTGEGSTLDDEEHLALVELAVRERPAGATIIANAGSNDTRHSIHLTERCTELGVDGTLNVVGYYNRPNRRGIVQHYRTVAAATDRPIVIYNIPSRSTINLDPDLLAELGQIEHVDALKQANGDELQPIDGLDLYAGNDDILGRTLDLGGAGGICVASHLVGPRMAEMVTATPERRAEIDAELHDLYEVLGVTVNPIPVKAALDLAGHPVGGLRLPLVEADAGERERIRAVLADLGLLAA